MILNALDVNFWLHANSEYMPTPCILCNNSIQYSRTLQVLELQQKSVSYDILQERHQDLQNDIWQQTYMKKVQTSNIAKKISHKTLKLMLQVSRGEGPCTTFSHVWPAIPKPAKSTSYPSQSGNNIEGGTIQPQVRTQCAQDSSKNY